MEDLCTMGPGRGQGRPGRLCLEDPGTSRPLVSVEPWNARQGARDGEAMGCEGSQGEGEGCEDLDAPTLGSPSAPTLGSPSAPTVGKETMTDRAHWIAAWSTDFEVSPGDEVFRLVCKSCGRAFQVPANGEGRPETRLAVLHALDESWRKGREYLDRDATELYMARREARSIGQSPTLDAATSSHRREGST